MVLATVGPDGTPSTRVVLLKVMMNAVSFLHQQEQFEGPPIGGESPRFSLFYWNELGEQVRITGRSEVFPRRKPMPIGLPGREGASWAVGRPFNRKSWTPKPRFLKRVALTEKSIFSNPFLAAALGRVPGGAAGN